jgi:PAS domain S-box-containing protein
MWTDQDHARRDADTPEDAPGALQNGHTTLHREAARLFDARSREAVRAETAALVASCLGHDPVALYEIEGERAEATYRTDAFVDLFESAVIEPVPSSFTTAVEMGVPRSETDDIPLPGAAAYCVVPTGYAEVLVCGFSVKSCLGPRFRDHLNEIGSLAGTALYRVGDDETAEDQTASNRPATRAGSDSPLDRDGRGGNRSDRDAGGGSRPDREAVMDALDQSFPDYAFLYDREGHYIDVLLGRRTFGVNNRDEIVGSTVHEILSTEAADKVLHAIQQCIDDWETVSVEYPVETGGQTQYYEGMVSPLSFDGRETAVLVARDVTELRRQREQLRRRNERLEAFTSIVCHDLKNPLNTAQGYLELLENQVVTETEQHGPIADNLDTITRALERMEEISQGVLALAHHEHANLDEEAVSLRDLTADCWEMTATANATLTVDQPFTILADPTSLRHVFENLFANSVTHGGPDVTISVGRMDDGFYVADDGPGIPEEHRELIFETGASFDEEGSGIGLVVVETVADAHGWDVTATESEDGGARFEFTGVEFPE